MTAAVAIDTPPAGALPLANARHERFCQEYLVDRNGSAAYLRAGYKATDDAAKVAASRLLTLANVSARVAYLEALRAERVGMTADDVLRELRALGTSDVRHYEFTDDGIKLADNAPDTAMRAVQSVRRKVRRIEREDGPAEIIEEVEFKLWSKPAALRMAGEVHKLYTQKIESQPPPEQNDSGEAVMRRLATALPMALVFLPSDTRMQALKQLRAAEEIVVEPKPKKGAK